MLSEKIQKKLDEAFEEKALHKITAVVVAYLESELVIRPKFSDFEEIVIEYLSDYGYSDISSLAERYFNGDTYDTKLVLRKLKEFNDYRYLDFKDMKRK
jgi:hypothetical protein